MILPWNLLEKQPRILNIHQHRKRVDEGREGSMSNLSRKDRGSSDSGSESRDDGDTEIDADIAKEKLDSCVHLLGKLITEVRDLKQRRTSNNAGSSGVESATSAVDTHLKLDTRDEVTAFEERLESSAEFKNEFKLFLKNFPTGTKNSVRLETIGSGLAIEADDKNTRADAAHQDGNIQCVIFVYYDTKFEIFKNGQPQTLSTTLKRVDGTIESHAADIKTKFVLQNKAKRFSQLAKLASLYPSMVTKVTMKIFATLVTIF
ncbi:hypothetical protein EVAR_83181_1 [Eumeta japonica]|uniref:Uncharacterized protein n=1 Tax=Eumeta variegata TaxID=151549 RepID=A0A4C1ZZF4_EUMVA|nr:hypothetical protein EVAR_83181_1 [Eumeta japonica]